MTLFGRNRLPHRSTLSRFLAAIDPTTLEDLHSLFQEDLTARPRPETAPGGMWDRSGTHQVVCFVKKLPKGQLTLQEAYSTAACFVNSRGTGRASTRFGMVSASLI